MSLPSVCTASGVKVPPSVEVAGGSPSPGRHSQDGSTGTLSASATASGSIAGATADGPPGDGAAEPPPGSEGSSSQAPSESTSVPAARAATVRARRGRRRAGSAAESPPRTAARPMLSTPLLACPSSSLAVVDDERTGARRVPSVARAAPALTASGTGVHSTSRVTAMIAIPATRA